MEEWEVVGGIENQDLTSVLGMAVVIAMSGLV
jgi:hypothetical protein